MRSRTISACVLLQLLAVVAYSATYIVPTDREMVRRAQAIVIGEALASYTQLNDKGGVETVTPFSVSEVIKGRIHDDTINIYEPGGRYGDHITIIPGVPRFTEGEKLLLFLSRGGAGRWGVTVLALGRFSFATDRTGRSVVVRAESDVVGWEPNGEPHKEMRRSADAFIEFIRAEASGGVGKNDYVVPFEPLPVDPTAGRKIPARTLDAPTPVSYTTDSGGGQGARWNVFPTAVTFKTAFGGSAGATAVTTAIANWNTAAGAQVNYSNGGTDTCSAGCSGLMVADGVNDVLFEENLNLRYGAGTFSCSAGSFGGLLGLGGVSAFSPTTPTHSFSSGTWYTTSEADVEMNTGLLACVGVGPSFTATYLAMAVTHELGHTLGFRHADLNRTDTGACDPLSAECTSSAVMYHFVPNVSGLLTYDLHAVDAVYPAATAPPTPTGLTATATSLTSVDLVWNTSAGATSYQVYRKSVVSGGSTSVCSPVAPTVSCTDALASANTAYAYYVVALNGATPSGNSAYALATTVVYTDDPIVAQTTSVKAVHITQLRTAVNAVRTLAGLGAASWTTTVNTGSTVNAADVTDLRTNLDAAMTILGLTTGGYTDGVLTGVVVKAAHLSEIRTRMK